MKRMFNLVLVLVVVMLLALSGTVFALGNNTQADADSTAIAGAAQQQGQIGINKNANNNLNANLSSNKNSNANTNMNKLDNKQAQGQAQGQGQGQAQGQVANGTVKTDTKVKVEGDSSVYEDNSEETYYGNAWPSTNGNVGVSEANAYSIFGGIGVSSTEEYKVCIDKLNIIDTLVAKGYMSKEDAQTEMDSILKDLNYNTSSKRFLGVLWKTSGRNLANCMGLLAWNSFWKEGATPMDKVFEPKQNTIDEEVTGNQGYLN